MGTEVSKHTPLPWSWGIHDYSLASLTGPKEEEDHVLSVSPCKACMEGAKRKSELPTWQWGRCTTPSLADAEFIVAAVNGYEPMRKALEAMVNERYSELVMMSCEYPRGSAEAIAWESGVRQAWRLWDLSK